MGYEENVVSLARAYYPVTALGPGNRMGIWLCGCPRRCSGCIAPELQQYDPDREIPVSDVMSMVNRIDGRIDGFTISGGEPFFRPKALSALVKALSEVSDDILIYTGYTYEELKAMGTEEVSLVLEHCAAIVDGPYKRELNDNRGLRGSSNQRLLLFKHAEKYAGMMEADRQLQSVVYGDKLLTIGIP